ncbi:hypothetical protein KFE94_15295 [bacterium SCSIO 12643]|nr:hypothetical protein KFE94_15295 [bacterium SCSIO 12643]
MNLKEVYIQLCLNYLNDRDLINLQWTKIEKAYTDSKRYYHGLRHIEHIWIELNKVKENVRNWNVILFTMFYHDIVYKAHKQNNEEASAEFAQKVMRKLSVGEEDIDLCYQQILATKSHIKSTDSDTNYFVDTDLAILGSSGEIYQNYTFQIRKEYSIYPDILYKPGRRKVIQHFLNQEQIFKTDFFRDLYESKARQNLSNELNSLS